MKIMENPENKLILYQDENGITKVSVRFSDEDLWLTELQIAEIYDTTQQNINQHIRNIYADSELQPGATYKKFLLVRNFDWKFEALERLSVENSRSAPSIL